MKILVSFSGGKDSQACLIQAFKQYGGGNLTAVFCDTGWEHPDTYKHVNDVCLQMGVRLMKMLKFMMAGENITYMNVINAIIIR